MKVGPENSSDFYDYLGPKVSCFLELQDQVSYKTVFLQKKFHKWTHKHSSLLHLIGEIREIKDKRHFSSPVKCLIDSCQRTHNFD